MACVRRFFFVILFIVEEVRCSVLVPQEREDMDVARPTVEIGSTVQT